MHVASPFCSVFFFFFSSRRRHTRLQGDWSSDVCSSDLRRPDVDRRGRGLRGSGAPEGGRHVARRRVQRVAEVGGEAQAGRRRDVPDPRRPGGGAAPDLERRAGEAWPRRALGVHLASEHHALRRAHTAGRLVGQHLAGGVEAKVMAFLEIRGLSKTFPGATALDGVDLSAEGGEVHALVGANGAGKSTLMLVLAGVLSPTAGEIRLAGVPVAFGTPRAAMEAGVSIVYQETSAIPEMTVAENILLGREPTTRLGWVDRRRLFEEARRLLDRHHP